MAKLPKKISPAETAKGVSLRQFVSTAAHKPSTASAVTRINVTMTEDDLSLSSAYQEEGSITRAEVLRAGLLALEMMPDSARQELFSNVRKNSPKAGRPPVNK